MNLRLTPARTIRQLEVLCSHYLDLARAYRKSASSTSAGARAVVNEMHQLMEVHQAEFASDHNLGLIKQLIKSLVKNQITRLTQTYITYSLADIANQVNLTPNQQQQPARVGAQQPPQPAPAQLAERYVFDMVSQN